MVADFEHFIHLTSPVYIAEVADWAYSFNFGDPIPRINYTDSEVKTWGAVWNKIRPLMKEYDFFFLFFFYFIFNFTIIFLLLKY